MKQLFHVSGTTCQSCEIVIERAVKKIPGVSRVLVSHKKHLLEVEADRELKAGELQVMIADHGYRIESRPQNSSKKQPVNWSRLGGMMVIVFGVYWILSQTGLFAFSPSASEPAGFFAVFLLGLIASVSSCTAVVGGLLVAVSSQWAKVHANASAAARLRPHVFFNLGRLIGFAAFGAIIGLIGSSVQLNPTLNGLFVFVIAAVMILIGINLLELFPSSPIRLPKRLAHAVHDLADSPSPFAPMLLGALTFFLPCGFTQSMQLYALTLQDPFQSGLVLFVFALGTMPALLGIGSVTSFAKGQTLKRITKAAGVLVLVLGMSQIVNAATLLGFTVTPSKSIIASAPAPVITDGKQYIQMEITNQLEYYPDVLTVKKGIPVEWEIYGGKFLGCANTLVSPALGINTSLKSGRNIVRFTPTKTGKFTFSCAMGMFRGTMIVTD